MFLFRCRQLRVYYCLTVLFDILSRLARTLYDGRVPVQVLLGVPCSVRSRAVPVPTTSDQVAQRCVVVMDIVLVIDRILPRVDLPVFLRFKVQESASRY
jgi:hypothetical protein